jgi:hypothetical protein
LASQVLTYTQTHTQRRILHVLRENARMIVRK